MHDFEDAPDGEYVYMGNVATARIMGKGKVFFLLLKNLYA